jgi:hypothetical protein
MAVVKNRPDDYRTRAKLGAGGAASPDRQQAKPVSTKQLLSRVRCIDSLGYVHWNVATKSKD